MNDIKLLNELHAATTQGDWHAVQYADNWCLQDGPNYGDRRLDGGDEDCECPTVSTEQGESNTRFAAESHNAWPAVAEELAESREQMELLDAMKDGVSIRIADLEATISKQAARLALYEEFARRVRADGQTFRVGEVPSHVILAVDWLDAETKKAGE